MENLKAQEAETITETKVSEVLRIKEEISSYPIDLLGGFSTKESIDQATLTDVKSAGENLLLKYQAAGERYETMQTEVRKDLGDSIKKAFENVDDILEDLGFEATESNERAVRILGYKGKCFFDALCG